VLVALLLVAEILAVGHPLDSAAHANGEPCNVCASLAGFSNAAVADAVELGIDTTVPVLVASGEEAIVVAAAPVRSFARGPPIAS
jgi:hypothetical protein